MLVLSYDESEIDSFEVITLAGGDVDIVKKRKTYFYLNCRKYIEKIFNTIRNYNRISEKLNKLSYEFDFNVIHFIALKFKNKIKNA